MFSDYDQGGLRAPSIDVLSKLLMLAWISRLLGDEHKSSKSWKAIPNYIIFEKYGAYRLHTTMQLWQEIP